MQTVDSRSRLRTGARPRARPMLSSLVPAAIAGIAALGSGWYIAQFGITYKEILVLLLAAGGVAIVLAGERGLTVGLAIWTLTLGLGYRTIAVTEHIKLHPSELLLLGLLGLLLVTRLILGTAEMSLVLPRWVLWMIPFWLWGWVPALVADRPSELIFAEFRNSLLLVPLFLVVANLVRARNQLYGLLLAFYATGTYIATLGLMEYVFPGVAHLLPGFIRNPGTLTAADGFQRAAFSFYGHQNAVFVCAFALPFGLALADRASQRWHRFAIAIAFLLQISGVFIAGFRSMWLALAVVLSAMLIRYFGFARGVSSVVLVAFLSYPFLPDVVERRVDSLFFTLEGRPDDSSGQDRWMKAKDVTDLILKNPLGHGWAGAGWVHSDFLQVAGNLGVVAGVIFLGAYILALHRLWRRLALHRAAGTRSVLLFSLFLSFLTAGWVLATEPMIVLPQTILPIWLVWVLVELELRGDPGEEAAPASHL